MCKSHTAMQTNCTPLSSQSQAATFSGHHVWKSAFIWVLAGVPFPLWAQCATHTMWHYKSTCDISPWNKVSLRSWDHSTTQICLKCLPGGAVARMRPVANQEWALYGNVDIPYLEASTSLADKGRASTTMPELATRGCFQANLSELGTRGLFPIIKCWLWEPKDSKFVVVARL